MFKNHPKGLLGAALSNMGERFGFYIMMAILSLFLMSKFGLEKTSAGIIYSIFYALIYILALVGGRIADKTKKYKSTIFIGLILMAIGYILIAIPTPTPVPNLAIYLGLTCFGLLVIAFGNGLFKGNLQAVVGQMYDKPEYSKKRDVGFQLFYMFINVGALFAPLFAVGIRNWWVESKGFLYNADLPGLCHKIIGGNHEVAPKLSELAEKAGAGVIPVENTDKLIEFANQYLDIFNTGFHYAFGIAIIAMLISLTIYIVNKNKFPNPAEKKAASSADIKMTAQEIKQRFYALFAVFAVVIFFWFSFHQNGLTLTYFAKEYTNLSMLSFKLGPVRFEGAEIFQFFNPFFVVFLTPVVIAFFGWLRAKDKEPSTPRKIAIGMGIAAIAFIVMLLGSTGLPSNKEIIDMHGGALPEAMRVTPFLLIGTYFILTIAELFISPLGLAFVSKVAPPQHQGIMQGCWLGATALGNQLLFIGAILYESIHPKVAWGVFVAACLISMCTMLAMVKWLERVTK